MKNIKKNNWIKFLIYTILFFIISFLLGFIARYNDFVGGLFMAIIFIMMVHYIVKVRGIIKSMERI